MIFERLNTGGTSLQPQEIRVALYSGPLIELLRELNESGPWRQLVGKKSPSLKDHELILRFFALLFMAEKYERPMKEFLNEYLAFNRHCDKQKQEDLRAIFTDTVGSILELLGPRAFRLKAVVNAALADAVLVGMASRLSKSTNPVAHAAAKEAYSALLQDNRFIEAISKSTADEKSVADRLSLAKSAFEKC
jgi:hypothetical protein